MDHNKSFYIHLYNMGFLLLFILYQSQDVYKMFISIQLVLSFITEEYINTKGTDAKGGGHIV